MECLPVGRDLLQHRANAAALTAMDNAIASWNNDANSNVNLFNGGVDSSGTHTGGLATGDGQNTVAFELNLTTEYDAPAFSCSSSSYSGVLGIAAVTNDSGTHIGPNGDTFYTSAEGDVEMNTGLSACTLFIGLGDFNSAVAHELGVKAVPLTDLRTALNVARSGLGLSAVSYTDPVITARNTLVKAVHITNLRGRVQ